MLRFPTKGRIVGVVSAMALTGVAATMGAALATDRATGFPSAADPSTRVLHGQPSEMSYRPLTPCRIVDTRKSGGSLKANEQRSFVAAGTSGFDAQGGVAGGCGIPPSASAIQVTITALKATGNGWLRAFPDNVAAPQATFMNYSKSFNVTGSGTVTLHTPDVADFAIKNFFRSTQLLIDVQGFYVPPMAAQVLSNGTLNANATNPRTVAAARTNTGIYTVTFDRDITLCTPVVSTIDRRVTSATTAGTVATISIATDAGVAIDSNFYVAIFC